jgi:hypothetical protein
MAGHVASRARTDVCAQCAQVENVKRHGEWNIVHSKWLHACINANALLELDPKCALTRTLCLCCDVMHMIRVRDDVMHQVHDLHQRPDQGEIRARDGQGVCACVRCVLTVPCDDRVLCAVGRRVSARSERRRRRRHHARHGRGQRLCGACC